MADTPKAQLKTRLKTWSSAGIALVATAGLAQAGPWLGQTPQKPLVMHLAEGGEGGESGGGESESSAPAASAAPKLDSTTYALQSTDPNAFRFDAKAEVEAYADLVGKSYAQSAELAEDLEQAIEALLDAPSEQTLADARAAWNTARPAYLRTEAFRFYDGPIEALEGDINSWPLNEAFIDYVKDDPKAGIINDPKASIAIKDIAAANQKTDEKDVTTGWHAIEFLLWGQDLSPTSAGNRPYTDFIKGQGNNDRRREYLEAVAEKLQHDLAALAKAWEKRKPGNYRDLFLKLDQREALGRMVNGMAVLAGYELMSERIGVALDSGDQEDEQSCFSDTTGRDFINDLEGIEAVWKGLSPLVASRKADAADAVNAQLAKALAEAKALPTPWDSVLAADAKSAPRLQAEEFVSTLQSLADSLKTAGNALGVLVLIPSE